MKIYKRGDKLFIITTESIHHSLFKDILSIGLLILLAYINYTYIGNSWYIGLFIILIMIGFASKLFEKEITKSELLLELK